MAMHGDLSPQARERAARTVVVAGCFAEHADEIVAALATVPDEHVLVAVVDAGHEFVGTHQVDESELVSRIRRTGGRGRLGDGVLAGRRRRGIRHRTAEMADIARKRMELIDRILARRSD